MYIPLNQVKIFKKLLDITVITYILSLCLNRLNTQILLDHQSLLSCFLLDGQRDLSFSLNR